MRWGWIAVLVTCVAAAGAPAQNVRRDSLIGWGFFTRKFRTAAEAQHRNDWPDLRNGDPGTQVCVTFDPRNADVILVTNASFGLQRLMGECRAIAAGLRLP